MTAFLDHLGLGTEADERAIKRAYARLLKQIDQAADPQGFQALREAYEASLQWHHRRQQSDDGVEAAVDQSDTQADAPAEHSDESAPSAEEAELAEPHPHAGTHEVFNRFMEGLTSHEGDKASMAQALAQALEDPRLQSLEARDMFEWFVAQALTQGWRPGHEVLLVAAIEFFEWHQDRRRLLRFGRVGQMLDESIAERMVFDGQRLFDNKRQKEVIRLLRREPRAEDAAEAVTYRQDLELMVHHFPNWLWMIVPAERTRQWREWGASHASRAAGASGTAPPSVPPLRQAAEPEKKSRSPLWFFLGLMMVLGVLSNVLKGHHEREASRVNPTSAWSGPALTQPDPFAAIKTYNDRPSASQTLPEPIVPPKQAPITVPSNPVESPTAKALAALTRGGSTPDACRQAADIAQAHGPAVMQGQRPFNESFDALLSACAQRHLWPRPGDPVLIAALERETARAQADFQKALAASQKRDVPPVAYAASMQTTTLSTGRIPAEALNPTLDVTRDLFSVKIKTAVSIPATAVAPPSRPSDTRPAPTGTGLVQPVTLERPKPEMPAVDYRLTTSPSR